MQTIKNVKILNYFRIFLKIFINTVVRIWIRNWIRIHNSEFMDPNSRGQLITDPPDPDPPDPDPPHCSLALKTRFGCVGDTCALVSRWSDGYLNSDFSIYREKNVLFQLKLKSDSEKFKNKPLSLWRPRSVNFRQHFRNLSCKTAP
jgi:hypothetical protein